MGLEFCIARNSSERNRRGGRGWGRRKEVLTVDLFQVVRGRDYSLIIVSNNMRTVRCVNRSYYREERVLQPGIDERCSDKPLVDPVAVV